MEKETGKLLLKDKLLNKKNVRYLADLLINVYPEFDKTRFEKEVIKKLPHLELKERVYWVRENIEKHLPRDYKKTLAVLLKAVKDEPAREEFIILSFSDYVAVNGCDRDNLERSLNALGEFTRFFSSELDIRAFINKFPEETFVKMQRWSLHKDYHKRRLATEGLRPKLPWARAIDFDYKKGSKVLDNLFYDKKRVITRSVANHLNDISKTDPDFVLEKLGKWRKSKKQSEREMDYIIGHSLRTSVKRGHENSFKFLGFDSNPKINIRNLRVYNEVITLGGFLSFSFEIKAKADEDLIVDYKIIYPTPHKRRSEKVFKIKKVKMNKDEEVNIKKKHLFKKMTTKRLYSGNYKLEIQVNSKILASTAFTLKIP